MTDAPVYGQQDLSSGNTPFNQLSFVIQQALAKMNVATLVQVQAIYTTGPAGVVGTVDILPLVNQVDGAGVAVPHGTIFNVPYLRIQGGANAVIIDPVVGDIGFCVFADRDISSVQATAAQGNPGSARRFDMADGLYLGGWCSTLTPANYLQINGTQVQLVFGSTTLLLNGSEIQAVIGATTLLMNSSGFTLTGNTKVVGNLEVTGTTQLDQNAAILGALALTGSISSPGGTLTATVPIAATNFSAGSVDLKAHTHTGVTTGGGSTGGPVG
jgi:hypothetical protein